MISFLGTFYQSHRTCFRTLYWDWECWGGFECWAGWSVWMGGWVWVVGRFVGCVCSWEWITVEIQHLIYQYKVLKKRGENFLFSFFSQTVRMLFSFGTFLGCFDQLTVGPPLFPGLLFGWITLPGA